MSNVLVLDDFRPATDYTGNFTHIQGKMLQRFLNASGISGAKKAYVINNICAIGVKISYLDSKSNWNTLSPAVSTALAQVMELINSCNPNIIICLGRGIFKTLTTVDSGKYRGFITPTTHAALLRPYKVLFTYDMYLVGKKYNEQFTVLQDCKKAYQNAKTPEVISSIPATFCPKTFEETMGVLDELEKYSRLAFDLETVESHITHVGFAVSPDKGFSICLLDGISPQFTESEEIEIWLRLNKLFDSGCEFIAHNATYDCLILYKQFNIRVRNMLMDTMLAAHCILPEGAKSDEDKEPAVGATKVKATAGLGLGLSYLTSVFLDTPAWKHIALEDKAVYNALDCTSTFGLYEVLNVELDTYGTKEIFNHEMSLLEPAMYLEYAGHTVDREVYDELREYYLEKVEKAQILVNELAGKVVNVNSPKQISNLLYVTLDYPIQYSFNGVDNSVTSDKEALIKLDKLGIDKIPRALLDCKESKTILSRYFHFNFSDENRVHCSWRIAGTNTGRFSCGSSIVFPFGNGVKNKLNMQCIPKPARKCFVANKKGWKLGTIDYAQAEAQIVAYLIGDERSKAIFVNNFGKPKKDRVDLHVEKAKLFFPGKEITTALRDLGKRGKHATNYGMRPGRLAGMLGISRAEATNLMKAIHTAEPEINQWHSNIELQVTTTKTLTTPFHRKRTFFDRLYTSSKAFDGNKCYAYIPQSTIADLLNYGLVRFYNRYGSRWNLYLQLHDAVYIEYPEEDEQDWIKAMRECFIFPVKIGSEDVYVDIDFSVGFNWKDLVELTQPGQTNE